MSIDLIDERPAPFGGEQDRLCENQWTVGLRMWRREACEKGRLGKIGRLVTDGPDGAKKPVSACDRRVPFINVCSPELLPHRTEGYKERKHLDHPTVRALLMAVGLVLYGV